MITVNTVFAQETDELQRATDLIDRYDVRDAREQDGRRPVFPKEIWQLADDEILSKLDGQWRVVKVQDSENPLFLLNNFIAKHPDDPRIAEALFQKASYYQMRKQFPAALTLYDQILNMPNIGDIQKITDRQRKTILESGVRLGKVKVCATGEFPQLEFDYRNARVVKFIAWQFDFTGFMTDVLYHEPSASMTNNVGDFMFKQKTDWKPYRGEQMAEWQESFEPDGLMLVREGVTRVPIDKTGVYCVEATVEGGKWSRTLVAISPVALRIKNLRKGEGALLGLTDAKSGKPVADAMIKVIERQDVVTPIQCKETVLRTNADGVAVFKEPLKKGCIRQVFVTTSEGSVFSCVRRWLEYSESKFSEQDAMGNLEEFFNESLQQYPGFRICSLDYVFQPFGSFSHPDLTVSRPNRKRDSVKRDMMLWESVKP